MSRRPAALMGGSWSSGPDYGLGHKMVAGSCSWSWQTFTRGHGWVSLVVFLLFLWVLLVVWDFDCPWAFSFSFSRPHVHTGHSHFLKAWGHLPTQGGHRIDFDCILHQGGSCDSGYSIDSTYVMIGASQTAPPPLQNRKDKGNTNLQSTEIQNIPKATQTNTDPSGIVLICLAFASLINSVSCNAILFLYWGFCNGGEGFQSLCKQKSSLLLIADLRLHDTFSAELLFKRVAAQANIPDRFSLSFPSLRSLLKDGLVRC
jgi:hypothetical protein